MSAADIVASALRSEAEHLLERDAADPLAESLKRIAEDIAQSAWEQRMGDDL